MKRKEDQGSQNWLCIEDSSAKGEGRGLGEDDMRAHKNI